MVLSKIKKYGELVMFSHTIFSLPFGLVAMIFAADGWPSFWVIFWIIIALFGARNGANAFNRIADRYIDAKNPRTAHRHLAVRSVSLREAWAVTILCFIMLAVAAYMLNTLCLILMPVAIGLFFLYSYSKRFTWMCHIILGICCGGAPVGAWIAVRGSIDIAPLILGAIVTAWVAGFDIIYALSDIEFDRREKIHSIPSRFGERNARIIAALLHIAAVIMLFGLFYFVNLGYIYLCGIALISILLIVEHRSITVNNLKQMKIASYSINQIIAIVFLVFTLLGFWTK